jgi:hypothetical protein
MSLAESLRTGGTAPCRILLWKGKSHDIGPRQTEGSTEPVDHPRGWKPLRCSFNAVQHRGPDTDAPCGLFERETEIETTFAQLMPEQW